MNYILWGDSNLLFAGIIFVPALFIAVMQKMHSRNESGYSTLIQWISGIQFVHIILSFGCLVTAFLTSDFNIKLIALNSQLELPWYYRLASLWSNHEGSMMLWIFMTACCHVIYLVQTVRRPNPVAHIIQIFVLSALSLSLYFTSNPFMLAEQTIDNGLGLNPLLHDPAMLIHPPSLYIGLIGFTVPFAIACSLLWRPNDAIAKPQLQLLHSWILAAFSLLTVGITLGSIWAYYELGWGGYWYWDPVETLSILPWLMGLIIIHLLKYPPLDTARIITISRNTIVLYLLILMGTYLSRSGIITSVHAFAYDPYNGMVFLGLAGGVTLLLLTHVIWQHYHCALHSSTTDEQPQLWRWQRLLSLPGIMRWQYRLIAIYIVILCVSLIVPAYLSVFMNKNTVIQPYFYTLVTLVIFITLAYLMNQLTYHAVNPLTNQMAVLLGYLNNLILPIVIIIISAMMFNLSLIQGLMVMALFLSIMLTLRTLHHLFLKKWNLAFAHFSFALIMMGVSVNYLFGYQQEVIVSPKASTQINGISFQVTDIHYEKTPLYTAERATVRLSSVDPLSKERQVLLQPEKRLYTANNMLTSKTAIYQAGLSHYYIALGGEYPDKRRAIFFGYFPMIGLIWLGGLLLSLTTAIIAYQTWRLRLK